MSNEEIGVLTASQRKAMQTACTKCSEARALADYLDQLGIQDQELRDRIDHADKLASKALEVDRRVRSSG